ncbi:MAG: LytTR family DNA-binding domain-containing protein [Saprospiraceae bacterium]
MTYLIIEDEFHAAKRLGGLISELIPDGQHLETIDSVEEAVEWFENNQHPDLVFMDIQLADGLSFEIFKKTNVEVPVIFTTAFNEYALNAFKTNSLDYLLKPVDKTELPGALEKFDKLFGKKTKGFDMKMVEQLLNGLTKKEYPKRFLIKSGQGISFVQVEDIAWFSSEEGITFIMTHQRKRHHLDYTLEQLEEMLDPLKFFRVNRKSIVGIEGIEKVSDYFNSRLSLRLQPAGEEDCIVSRERVKGFKQWLGA